jgi:hypothetical protein
VIGRTAEMPDLPSGADMQAGVQTLVKLNRQLTSLPCVHGTVMVCSVTRTPRSKP